MSNIKHNMYGTPVYNTWCSMIARCNPNNKKDAPYYSDRGITVCDRWKNFVNFYADMGDRPDGMTIERMDNNKGYSPDNCKWLSRFDQNRNKRSNRIIEFNGASMCIADWAIKLGRTRHGLYWRLKNMPIDLAMTERFKKEQS